MKKVYYFFVLIIGINWILESFYGIYSLYLISIFETNFAYNCGYVLGKIARIFLGLFLIKYFYDFYFNESRYKVKN